ncbi:hypothetical protein F4818DRAFT_425805 [Hypoxylon cercidicola]|nr:hypothetical protein F4818DRAFT_425805 [Hypoxylon cercidicola]
MSSTSSLSRTRSLRKPTTGSHEFGKKDGPATRSEARNTSPSRLPVKPGMTTRSAAASSSSTTTTTRNRALSSTTGRPLSGVYSKPPQTLTNGTTRPLGRAPSTRQPSSSTTTGISSTRTASTTTGRPRSSGGPPPTTASNRLMGHSRSKSTVTSLTSATTLRPISSQQSSTSSGRTSPTASTVSSASSKPQTRSQTHARAKSQSQSQIQSQTTSSSIHQGLASTHRPAFNTHQQHYSPAKSLAPKPLTSTYLAPPSPSKLPANVALSAETSRLQTELLQLSLLRRDAAAVDAEWRSSAKQKLGARFAALASDHEALLRLERRGVEARNVAALIRWGDSGSGGRGLEEKVQVLDEVLNGVWQLGEPGGRYERVVQDFEAWADRMATIVAAQRGGDADALVDGEEMRFLGELDRGWKRDCVSLARKLEGWNALLRSLGDVGDGQQGSGLARMLDGCRALVRDMLAELAVMDQIERDAARAEDAWIESMNRAIEDEDHDTPAARAYVPLWKLAV